MQVQWNQCVALLLNFADEFFNLNRIQEEFAGAGKTRIALTNMYLFRSNGNGGGAGRLSMQLHNASSAWTTPKRKVHHVYFNESLWPKPVKHWNESRAKRARCELKTPSRRESGRILSRTSTTLSQTTPVKSEIRNQIVTGTNRSIPDATAVVHTALTMCVRPTGGACAVSGTSV